MKKVKIRLTEDLDLVNEIKEQLKQNDGYCPCRLDKTPDTKCMCKEFREQYVGICHCGLYEKYVIDAEITDN